MNSKPSLLVNTAGSHFFRVCGMWLLNRQDVVQYGRHFLVFLEEGQFLNLTMSVWKQKRTELF